MSATVVLHVRFRRRWLVRLGSPWLLRFVKVDILHGDEVVATKPLLELLG